MWKAIIEKHNNGYKVDFKGGDISGSNVYEEKNPGDPMSSEGDKEHVVSMLWDILDYFGENGSKHDKKRICITYEDQYQNAD